MTAFLINTALLLLAYLIGSIPFGLVFTRLFSSVDVRNRGSGNIGATNVARVAGPLLGIGTLAADILKGLVPVLLVMAVEKAGGAPGAFLPAAAALAAVLGHIFPVYTRFRGGGKGVATAAGAFSAISAWAVLVSLAVFGLVVGLTRRVSAASLSAAVILPPGLWVITGSTIFLTAGLVAAALIFYRHRENIGRLLTGTEPAFKAERRHQ